MGRRKSRERQIPFCAVMAGFVIAVSSGLYADVVVNPDGDGSTDVVFGASLFPLVNPVADPLLLGTNQLVIGNTGTGELEIVRGGLVVNGPGTIGATGTGVGTVTVDGDGSTWTNNGSLLIGLEGDGTLNITDEANVNTFSTFVGIQTTGTGRVTVDGAGSVLGVTNLGVGFVRGTGTVDVTGGGWVQVVGINPTDSAAIGEGVDSMGTVNVDGEDSLLTSSHPLYVGRDKGTGYLNLTNGGDVTAVEAKIGTLGVGSTGTVTVDGAGSVFTVSDLTVGDRGTGSLEVMGGGSVQSNPGAVLIGNFDTAEAVVVVEEAGSSMDVVGQMTVGVAGMGTLQVKSGATVTIDQGLIGDAGTAVGLVEVMDSTTLFEVDNDLVVGRNGANGELRVTGGGTARLATFDSELTVGEGVGTKGTATVDGAGSTLDVGRQLNVGVGGATAEVRITNGAQALGFDGEIGVGRSGVDDAGTSGVVTVDGPGSVWHLSNSLEIGGIFEDSFGTLNITNGGFVSIDQGLGVATNVSDVVTGRVSIHTGGVLRVGGTFAQQGMFQLLGGTVILGGDRTFDGIGVGDEDSLLTTLGGVLSNGQRLEIEGLLNLLTPVEIDGGALSAASIPNVAGLDFKRGFLGLTAVGLSVSPTGQFGDTLRLQSAQHLSIGQTVVVATSGRVELTGGRLSAGLMENNGVVTGDGQIDGPLDNKSGGEVRADLTETLLFTGAGNTNRGNINLLNATVEFEHDLINASGGRVRGRGTLIVQGGLTNEGEILWSGGFADVFGDVANTADARIEVTGGGVATFYDDVHNDGVIETNDGSRTVFLGTVTGSGDFTREGTVVFEGVFSPGSSPGDVAISGDVAMGADATLVMELAGHAMGESYDHLDVGGAFQADGTFVLQLLDGFTPSLGDTFELLDFESAAGAFETILLPELEHGLLFDTTSLLTTGSVSVVPEPAAGGFLVAAIAAIDRRRRRRRWF